MRGTVRVSKSDIAGAETDLQHTIELEPKNAVAYTRLADVRVLQRRFPEAEKLYEQALQLDPGQTEALQDIANLLMAQKQSEKLVSRIQAQVKQVPGNSSFHFLLAQVLLSTHKVEEAKAELQRAVELDPTNLNALFVLGQTQQEAGQLDEAASIYQRLIREHAKEVKPYLALGFLEEARGNWQRAEELYKQALDLDAGNATAANNLSYLLLERGGDTNYALSLAQIARRGMPESPNSADTLAWAYYQKGIYDSAIELLQEAVKKVPENATYRYHLGLAYQRVSKVSLARQNFQQALSIDPQSKRADEIRHALAGLTSN
jgi:tetratricopeptide (TPR) repeat protein